MLDVKEQGRQIKRNEEDDDWEVGPGDEADVTDIGLVIANGDGSMYSISMPMS